MSDTLETILSSILVVTLCPNFRIDNSNLEDLTVMAFQLYVIAKKKIRERLTIINDPYQNQSIFSLRLW